MRMSVEQLAEGIITNLPNFAGFLLLALILRGENRRLFDLLEKCLPDNDDD